jgi:glycosyltransferase involved in cell wall biosynthesis
MKVLMFGWEFPPYISGGLGTACLGLTRELRHLGAEITFVLPKVRDGQRSTFVNLVGPTNITLEEFEKTSSDLSHLAKVIHVDSALHPYMDEISYREHLKSIREQKNSTRSHSEGISVDLSGNYGENLFSEVIRYSRVGKFFAKKFPHDVIHAHDWMTYLAGVEAKKESGRPLVVHVHATEFDRSGDNGNIDIYNIEKYGMDMADSVITVSKRTKGIVIEKYHINPAKVHVVYNGVDQTEAIHSDKSNRPFKNDKIVLFLGRITMQKGPEFFLNAANIVAQKVPNVRFVMAGAGDMTKRMIEKMATFNLMERFHFTGFLGEADREKLFAMSDIYVMPSVSEPFGITPLEAMRYNIPIIISKQSGIAEVLDHVIKVDFWDVQQLAATIIDILLDPSKTQSMSKHHQQALDRMDWAEAARNVLNIYRMPR